MAGRLYRMAKVVSANPASWGIVDANQISGFRTVATLDDLYSIAACILSSSYGDGITTGKDAVGQIWYVQQGARYFRLTDWSNRDNENGWTEEITPRQLENALQGQIENVRKIANNADNTASIALNTANTNAQAIANKADKTTVDTLGQTVAGHTTSIGTINNTLKNKADSSTVSTLTDTVESIATDLTNFKALKEQANGLATLDGNKRIPLEQLGNLDTTLFEVVPELPSTIATIKKHIYLKTAETTGTKNNYAEYIYTGDLTSTATYDATKWEKLGEVTASVDLSGYYTKSEIDTKVNAIDDRALIDASISTSTNSSDIYISSSTVTDQTTNVAIPIVTTTDAEYAKGHNGLMSPAMLTKLNDLINYSHPTHPAKDSGLYKITVDGLGHVSAATLVTKDDIKPLAPDLTVAQSGSELAQDIKITYKGVTSTARLLSATNTEAGLLSSNNKKKLDGIAEGANKTVIAQTVTAEGANPVSGKGIYDAINTHKITNDNLSPATGTTYSIIGENDSETNEVSALTDSLMYQYSSTDHSTLMIDGAAVWDEYTLKAISNTELTKILV